MYFLLKNFIIKTTYMYRYTDKETILKNKKKL